MKVLRTSLVLLAVAFLSTPLLAQEVGSGVHGRRA